MLAAVSDQFLQSLFKQLSKWPKKDRVKDKQKKGKKEKDKKTDKKKDRQMWPYKDLECHVIE